MRSLLHFSALTLLAAAPARAVSLTDGHVDFLVRYQAGNWLWSVLDDDFNSRPLGSVTLEATLASLTTAPANPLFTPILGAPGAPVWILPPSQIPGQLFLGIDASTTGAGVFTGNQIKLTLSAVSGPGEFAMYQVDGFGTPTAFFNTRDGLTGADQRAFNSAAGHDHFAWAFSAPGDYSLSVVPSGTLTAGNVPVTGPAVQWNFQVVPEPGSAALLAIGALSLGAFRRRRRQGTEPNPGLPTPTFNRP